MNQLFLDAVLTDAGDVPDPSDETVLRARAALDAALVDTGDELAERRRRRSRRSVLIAAVAGVAAVAIAVPVLTVNGHRPAASAAAAVLDRTADAAGRQPGGWPDAKYWYSESREARLTVTTTTGRDGQNTETYRLDPPRTRKIWIAHRGHSVLSDPAGGEYLDLGGQPPFGIGSGTTLTWDQLYRLPTDPSALDRFIRSHRGGGGSSEDAEVFVNVGDLLRESPAPPALRKALWEVAARVPGVRLLGARTDHLGRTGTAVERDGQTYIVDTSTGALLEEIGSRGSYVTHVRQGPSATAPDPTTR